jgi:hypothetical protein
MTRKKTAASDRGLIRGTNELTSVARGATAPDSDDLLDFLLTLPVEDPETEALRLFPGPYAFRRHLRSAHVTIAAARASNTAADAWLGRARDAIGALQDLDHRPTPVEDALVAAWERFREAARACRHARAQIREAQRLLPRRRRTKLRIAS